ncbi:hypothetical protein OQ257_10340 [Actinobacillus equuli subsp. equuli]|uniref:Uncharacterized protein n=1 Tax=Actinobacillus equuli subsp. equuli TaxID=202947 RepID=A0A9X4G4A2_ACTEU|nr:hypothetical protein [Actinobacillus equuli]MDE8035557.1 hypothetical protein [Actinobacillus equuli subsp. equuli]MDG4947323.1 hypothetical protein [Actinobacillus equuli subsp. haemolyticus]
MTNFIKGFIGYFLFIICFIYMTGQLSDPYVRHDEWEFMIYLLPDMPNHGTPWDKTLWEGRWINYLWSFIARDFSVNANYLFFIIGYSLLCWSISSLFTENLLYKFIISISAFFCSAYADLSLWPATLSSSVWISFITLVLYKKYNKKIILLFSLSILVMSYAPLIAPCMIFIMLLNNRGFKNLLKLSSTYYIGYIIGVFIVYYLNYKYHNFLGVKIADWRNPNPIHSFQDLYLNLKKTIIFWRDLILENKLEILLSSTILFIYILKENNTNKVINILVSLFSIVALESALSIYTGVDIPTRAIIWPWFFFTAIVILALVYSNKMYIKLLGGVLALCLMLNGSERWYGFYSYESQHAKFENVLGNILGSQSNDEVYLCGNATKIKGLGNRELKPLTLALWKKNGIYLKQATEDECAQLNNIIGLQKINNKVFYKVE